jgi:hypothetical protein
MHRLRPSPEVVKAKQREIALHYGRRRKKRTAFQMSAIRVAELNRLFEARYGTVLPDDETGRECVTIAANHLMLMPGLPRERFMEWAAVHAPWLSVQEVGQILADAASRPQTWKADSLAWRLRLTYADRQALKITTIGAIDCNKAQRTKLRKAASKARTKRHRDAQKAATPAVPYAP